MKNDNHPKIVPIILEHTEKELATAIPYQVIRGSYRASEVGDCPRYQAYKQLGYARERIGPELELLFRMGHVVEREMIGYLRRSGFLVTNEQHVGLKEYVVDGTPIKVSASLDLLLDGKYIIDVKSTNFFTAKYLSSGGKEYILKKYRGYYDQIQTYLNIIDFPGKSEWGCLLFMEKMTSRIMEFWFKRDEKYFTEVLVPKLAKIERSLLNKKIPLRPKGYTKSCDECKRCTMRIHCWGKNMDRRTWS